MTVQDLELDSRVKINLFFFFLFLAAPGLGCCAFSSWVSGGLSLAGEASLMAKHGPRAHRLQ